jgi:leader peptidase (prepilin peptidase)/N-methyltransferase
MRVLEDFHRELLYLLRVSPAWAVLGYVFAVGTVVGSFLNVLIYRIPLGLSIVKPRSQCPNCKRKIPWYHNIPILSYVWLRGRCASCGNRISPVYPFVEFLTGLYFAMLFYTHGPFMPFLIYAVFGCIMIALIFIDYYHRLLPRVITFPGIVIGFAASFSRDNFINPWQSLMGIVIGGLIPLTVLLVYKWIRKKEGMGHGDIVMLALVGAFLGWKMVFLVILLASLSGVVIGGLAIVALKKGSDFPLPFGSFIGAAALVIVFVGRSLWRLYLGL